MSADVVCLIDELDPAEVFLIRALRNWAIGRRDGRIAAWAKASNAFKEAMGDDREARWRQLLPARRRAPA